MAANLTAWQGQDTKWDYAFQYCCHFFSSVDEQPTVSLTSPPQSLIFLSAPSFLPDVIQCLTKPSSSGLFHTSLSLNFNFNALLTILLLDILSIWPNHCTHFHCNSVNTFWIPASSLKSSVLISYMMMAWTKLGNREYIRRLVCFQIIMRTSKPLTRKPKTVDLKEWMTQEKSLWEMGMGAQEKQTAAWEANMEYSHD